MEKNYSLLLTEKEIDLIKSSLENSAAEWGRYSRQESKGGIFRTACASVHDDYKKLSEFLDNQVYLDGLVEGEKNA